MFRLEPSLPLCRENPGGRLDPLWALRCFFAKAPTTLSNVQSYSLTLHESYASLPAIQSRQKLAQDHASGHGGSVHCAELMSLTRS